MGMENYYEDRRNFAGDLVESHWWRLALTLHRSSSAIQQYLYRHAAFEDPSTGL